MAKEEDKYRDHVVDVVKAERGGLTVDGVVEALEERLGEAPKRRIRDLLNRLSEEGALVRTRASSQGRGAPPYLFRHPDGVPKQFGLFEGIEGVHEYKAHSRDEVEAEEMPEEERERTQAAVLKIIAEGFLHEDRYAKAVRRKAPDIAGEKPVELMLRFAAWFVRDVNGTADEMGRAWEGQRDRNAQELAGELDRRLQWGRRYFQRFFRLDPASTVGDPPILRIPAQAKYMFRDGERAELDEERARTVLSARVFGERIAEIQTPPADRHRAAAGTDASVADIFLDHGRGSFIPPDPVAVMTAAGALTNRVDGGAHEYQHFDFFPDGMRRYAEYRAAVEGLLIAPSLKQILNEGDFKHARMASMELRQYEEDLRIPMRQADWRPRGAAPALGYDPRPTLLIRDGRLFPLVHRLKDYEDDGLYGQIVRRQIERFSDVLYNTVMRPRRKIAYGATVKSPELSWLTPLVFFFLLDREIEVEGEAVVDEARQIYRVPFPDTVTSHLLFHGLAVDRKRGGEELTAGKLFTTCRVVRRFSDIAVVGEIHRAPALRDEDRLVEENEEGDWEAFFAERRRRREAEGRRVTLEEEDYQPFAYLCANAGVSMCYAMICSAYDMLADDRYDGGQFLLPRLEVAYSASEPESAEENFDDLFSWLADERGWEMDRYHLHSRFDVRDGESEGLFVAVPDVIRFAHEAVTTSRDVLDAEVKDEVRRLIVKLRRQAS